MHVDVLKNKETKKHKNLVVFIAPTKATTRTAEQKAPNSKLTLISLMGQLLKTKRQH